MNGCWILSNAFSASKEMITWFLSEFVYIADYVDGFPYIKPSLHPWNEAYLVMVMIILMCSWIRLAEILLSIFASIL